jgi:hypothetical protein
MGGDHLPVFMDIPIDCAHLRKGVTSIWNPHKGDPQLKWKEEPQEDNKEACEAFDKCKAEFTAAVAAKHTCREIPTELSLEKQAEAIMKGLEEAPVGSGVAECETLSYPNRAATCTTLHREGCHGEKSWTPGRKG